MRQTGQQAQAFADVEIQLWGGNFYGAESTFGVNVTHDIFVDITGVSLYQDWISPDVVKKMTACFRALSEEDIEALADEHDRVLVAINNFKKNTFKSAPSIV